MAKKSPKSSRRARAKKEQAPKKTKVTRSEQTAPEEPVIIAEGSSEPVVKVEKTEKAAPKKKTPAKKPKPLKEESAPKAEVIAADSDVAEQAIDTMVQPARSRMLVSAFALGVIVIALIFGANIMRQQEEQKAAESANQPQSSAASDDILKNGGKVCTNEQMTSDATGSSSPQSVGMMLQSNPSSTLQTPQTFGGGGSDASTLQGAACF